MACIVDKLCASRSEARVGILVLLARWVAVAILEKMG
jgi:hypothetical protein